MNAPRQNSAKILNHAEEMGVPSPDEVRLRARELAQIDGHNEPTEVHWQQARRELHGGHDFDDGNNEHDMQLLVSEHDFVAADAGHHTPKVGLGDDHIAEELVAEGMDEALHEQMLEARKDRSDEEVEEELKED